MMLPVSTKKPESTWISEVPSHWKESKNKYVFKLRKEIVGENWKNYTLLSLSKRGVVPRDIESGKGKFPESFDTYQVVRQSDLVFCLYDVEETPRAVGISETIGMITGSYDVLEVIDGEPKFFYYYYLTVDDFKGFKPLYTGMRNVVRPENFNNLKIYLPPLPEQQQIVTYLDHKTTLIDQIISGSEKKIELLKEKRTAIINHAVTKGLNPKVKMKDSGVEWIGEIPEGWEVTPLKHVTSINANSLSENTNPNYELEYIEISDVNNRGEILQTTKYTYSEAPSRCRRILRKGDVFISTVRTYLKSIGYVKEEVSNLICSTGFCVVTPKKISSEFLFYMVLNDWFINQVISNSEGVSYPSITSTELVKIKILLPKSPEQQEIVTYLDQKTKEIDDLISSEQKRIELMKEYRQSLISEVVTGKIKVTNE